MAKFQFLPAETKFYEWFEKATGNLLEAAEALEDLLDHYEQVESKVARITELEHRGDFIVHEVMHLLMHTLIIPLDGEDVERLISALDDSVDKIEATAVRMLIFRIEAPTEKARQLGHLIRSGAGELHMARKKEFSPRDGAYQGNQYDREQRRPDPARSACGNRQPQGRPL